jgi:RHS repeat-associated protein
MKKGLRWTPLALALMSAFAHASTADRVSTVTYNPNGLVATVDGPRTDVSDVTQYSYDAQGRLATVTDALGHVTTYDTYDPYGNPGRAVDANGVVTSMTYTPEGWLSTTTRDATGTPSTTAVTYDAVGNLIQTQDADGVILKYTFDDASRLTDITDGAGNRIHYTLDAAGNRTKEETFDASGALKRSVSRTFNSLSQLLTVVDALNRTVLAFDTTDGYDAEGHAVHSADAKGVQRKQGYDALNRLVSTIDDYNGTNTTTANTQTASTFDASDNLEAVSDPSSLNTLYDHNGLGDLTGIHSPDTGTTTFTVDAAGNRLTQTDARGVVTTYTYDALNRPLSASYSDATLNVAYHYDEANAVTGCAASAPIGRLTRIVENAVTTTYCYDPRGNVVQKKQVQGTATDTLAYSYTLADRVLTETRPSGAVVRYGHDALGQVNGVWVTPAGGSEQPVTSTITWLPFGPVASYTLGNGQTVTRTYDANYMVTDIVSPALELHFSRDAMGNITGVSEAGGGSASYGYDPLYRLTSVNDAGGNAVEAYTYNQTGDRTGKTGPGLATGAYTYQAGTHWLTSVGTASRTYDASGNTTGNAFAGNAWGYGFNGRGRMTVVQENGLTVGSYAYNARNERVGKTAGSATTRFVFDEGSQLVYETTGSASREYVGVSGIPLGVIDGSALAFVTADALGSPRAVTSVSGAVVWNLPYAQNPFGETQPISSAGFVLNVRFPGQYYDAESGTTQNVYRQYDASTGRYLTSDTLGLEAGVSTYGYVASRPLTDTDTLGREDWSSTYNPPPQIYVPKTDYYHVNLTYLIGSFSVVYTRNGTLFIGGGVQHGAPKSVTDVRLKAIGASFTGGNLIGCHANTAGDVDSFVQGASTGASGFYGAGGGISYNSTNTAIETGLGTPGAAYNAVEVMTPVMTGGPTW